VFNVHYAIEPAHWYRYEFCFVFRFSYIQDLHVFYLFFLAIGEIRKFYEEAEVKLISMKIKYILWSQQMLFKVMGDDSYMLLRAKKDSDIMEPIGKKSAFKNCRESSRKFLRIKDTSNYSLFEKSDTNVKIEDLFKGLNKNIDERFDALNSVVLKLNNDFNYFKDSIKLRTRRTST
jgi:hypothetical protein